MGGEGNPRDGWPTGADLPFVAGVALLAAVAATVPVVRGSPVRGFLGLALVLFLPGYALTAAAFPEETGEFASGIVERVALAVPLSLAVSLALGAVVGHVLGLGAAVVLGGLSSVTVAGCGIAAVRRGHHRSTRRAPGETDGAGIGNPASSAVLRKPLVVVRSWADDRSSGGLVLDLVIVVVIVVALVGVVYLVAVPKHHAGYAELALLSAETSGPDAAGYPASLAPGESASVVVGVEHHRPGPEEYTLVVVLQRVSTPKNGSAVAGDSDAAGVTIRSEREVRTARRRLDPGDRWTLEPSFAPDRTGRYRLVVRLYRDGPEETPTHRTHLWIDVGGGSNRTATDPMSPMGRDEKPRPTPKEGRP